MSDVGFDTSNCTLSTCSIKEYGELQYLPSVGANAFFLAVFIIGLLLQIWLGIKYRTWGYMVAMIGGCVLEIVGYIGRLMLHHNIFDQNNFVIYLVGLTIGPAFYSAAIYFCLGRIIPLYGDQYSPFKPRTITLSFIGCDILSLVLQAAGGALAATANTPTDSDTGVDIMIAGLSTQVAGTGAFCIICMYLMRAIRRDPGSANPNTTAFRGSRPFQFFLWAIGVATFTILIRCIFRVVELAGGFNSSVANNQASFIVLDSVMMTICIALLTAFHPGRVMGGLWQAYSFKARKQLARQAPTEKLEDGSETA